MQLVSHDPQSRQGASSKLAPRSTRPERCRWCLRRASREHSLASAQGRSNSRGQLTPPTAPPGATPALLASDTATHEAGAACAVCNNGQGTSALSRPAGQRRLYLHLWASAAHSFHFQSLTHITPNRTPEGIAASTLPPTMICRLLVVLDTCTSAAPTSATQEPHSVRRTIHASRFTLCSSG